MNCFRYAIVVNNKTVVNTFISDNNNITDTETQLRQIMATTAYGILKFEPMIKKTIVANYTFFTVIIFRNINSFA